VAGSCADILEHKAALWTFVDHPAARADRAALSLGDRDETKFETPDEFHWGRTQKHVAFGNGVHKCPGELLARLELRLFLEELLARTVHIDLAGVVEWARWPEYGPRVLPLRVVHKP
jgi:cytochrome P450